MAEPSVSFSVRGEDSGQVANNVNIGQFISNCHIELDRNMRQARTRPHRKVRDIPIYPFRAFFNIDYGEFFHLCYSETPIDGY